VDRDGLNSKGPVKDHHGHFFVVDLLANGLKKVPRDES